MKQIRYFRFLFAAVIGGFALCAAYARWGNPEVRFWHTALERKLAWAARFPVDRPRVLICGGSSAAFGIDPVCFEDTTGVPCANLALFAGAGTPVLVEVALREARPGDTIVLSLEPGLLETQCEVTAVGQQFLFAIGSPPWFTKNAYAVSRQTMWSMANLLRPGGYAVFTTVGKWVAGRRLYRYGVQDLSNAGWLTTANRHAPESDPGAKGGLSPQGREQLMSLVRWARESRVRIVVALPWGYAADEHQAAYRRRSAAYLAEIAEYFPVVREPALGADLDPADFGDTAVHLVAAAAQRRTAALAAALRSGDFWERSVLQAIAQGTDETAR